MTEPRIVYGPGDWVAVSRGDGWVLIQLPLTDPRVRAVWDGLIDSVDQVLDDLLRSGVRSLPGFAVLKLENDGLRCALRKPARMTVESQSGAQEYDGTARPYLDTVISPAPSRVTVHGSDSPTSIKLPMREGIVSAAMLTVDLAAVPAQRSLAGNSLAPPPLEVASVAPAAIEQIAGQPSHVEPATPEPVGPGPVAAESPAPEPFVVASAASLGRPEAARISPPEQQSKYHKLLRLETTDRQAFLSELRAEEEAAALRDVEESTGEPVPGLSVPPPSSAPGASTPSKQTSTWDDRLESPPSHTPPAQPASLRREVQHDGSPQAPRVTHGLPWAKETTRSIPAAAVPPVDAPPPPAPPASRTAWSAAGESSTSAPALSSQELTAVTTNRAALLRQLTEEIPSGPTVFACRCPRGHLSPPTAPICRVCGAPLDDQQPVQVARPTLGRLTFSNGLTVSLDRSVIFGRDPRPATTTPTDRPNLIRPIESGELSRTHASVTIDGWQVVLRDLGSTHGTFLTLPGGKMTKLRANAVYPLEPGSVVSLAEIVSFTYETTP